MKRRVNGHYAHPLSTRDLLEVEKEDFDIIIFSLEHGAIKLHNILKYPIENTIELAKVAIENGAPAPEKMSLDDITKLNEAEVKESLKLNISHIHSLIERAKSQQGTKEIIGINFHEYTLLIDCLIACCTDLTVFVNMDKSQLKTIADFADKNGMLETKVDIEERMQRITEEKIDDFYKKSCHIYKILEQINLPYEGAIYEDENGNTLSTDKFIPKKTPRNEIN